MSVRPCTTITFDVWIVSREPLDIGGNPDALTFDTLDPEHDNIIAMYSDETDANRCADLFLDMKKPTVTHLQLHKRGDANDWTCLVCGFRNRGHTLTCAGCGSHA